MKRLISLTGAATATVLLATGSVSADPASLAGPRTLEGAWQVVTTVRVPADNCSTAPPLPAFPDAPNPFPAFNTFHDGGTMSEWGSRSPPANRGSGHGVWERIGKNRFGYRLMFHSFTNGLLSATMDIRSRIRLSQNGEKFTGVSRFTRTAVDGTVLSFCATQEGQRFSY